jgi:hypothetical protein
MDNNTDTYITVLTFTYPHELAVIRGRLESEGIECFVKDELTVQVNPFYSNAIGGVKLQVKESDLEKAMEILRETGSITDSKTESPGLFSRLDKATSKIPILNKVRVEIRMMILIAVALGLILTVAYFVTLPSTFDRLISNSWCLDNVVYDNKKYIPETEDPIRIIGPGFYNESITFRANGTVTLPGFRSPTVWGKWQLSDGSLQISQADAFGNIYDGMYEIEFSNAGLVLRSGKTTLNCHGESPNF